MVNGIELSNILTCHSSQIPRHNEFHIAFRPGMYIDPVGILYYKIEFQKLGLFFMPYKGTYCDHGRVLMVNYLFDNQSHQIRLHNQEHCHTDAIAQCMPRRCGI